MLNLDEIRPTTFDFALDGNEYSIPSLDGIPAEDVLDLIDGEQTTADVVALFRRVMGKYAPDAIQKMSVAQFRALAAAYAKSGNAGEQLP